MATVAQKRSQFTVADFDRISRDRNVRDIGDFRSPPTAPDNVVVLGLKLGHRVQWSRVEDVDGYQITVSNDADLESVRAIHRVMGDQSLEFNHFVGDVAVAQFFAVQSFKGDTFSDFTVPQSATSKIDGGAADSAPATPPDQPQSPPTSEKPGWGRDPNTQ